jgi:hypothetical protein
LMLLRIAGRHPRAFVRAVYQRRPGAAGTNRREK